MFDVFYSGIKPNLFPHEREASDMEEAQQLSRTRYFWWVNYLIDYTDFDFLWEPVPWQNQYVHVWPSPWNQFHGACLVPKQANITQLHVHDCTLPAKIYKENFKTLIDCDFDYSWTPHPWDPPLIYVFGNQWWSAIKQPTVEYHAPGATERKYMLYPRAELKTCMDNWQVPDNVDVSTFDFSWRPDPGDPPYIYQFGTQHQRTGGPQYHVPGATDVKYVDQIRIKTTRVATAIYEIDHMDGNAGQIPDTTKVVRYFDNYLDTLKRIAKNCEHEFVWICSSVCDYTDFDFAWHPEVWQATMLHVFPSGGQKFGDTFFMHVPTFQYRTERLELLEWYDLNFLDRSVPRRPMPVLKHDYDSQVQAVKALDCPAPLALLTNDATLSVPKDLPVVPLWRTKTKTVVPLSAGATSVIVPKNSISWVTDQLYDYPHIDKTQRHLLSDPVLDIVFIENGEPNAEDNWKILLQTEAQKHNRIHRCSGVNGRVAAYHAAAELSTTPWFFAVFAKLRVRMDFDWTWQPDRLQQPKHYIFHAFNPINGLTYGHQAMIAYNRELVLNNPGQGLDFTLDSAHEVVPILSGTAEYAHSPWMAWRTAFRECIKLRGQTDVESQYRLDKWLTMAMGRPYGLWSIYGAEDAVEYYDSVNGDFEALRKSYDWDWLASYALIKRNLVESR